MYAHYDLDIPSDIWCPSHIISMHLHQRRVHCRLCWEWLGSLLKVNHLKKSFSFLNYSRFPDHLWASLDLHQLHSWCRSKESQGGRQKNGDLMCAIAKGPTYSSPTDPISAPNMAHYSLLSAHDFALVQAAGHRPCSSDVALTS